MKPIHNKSNYRKELILLLIIDSIVLISLLSLVVLGAIISQKLIISVIILLIINIAFFYAKLLYKYFLLLFLLLTLFDILEISFIKMSYGYKFIKIELFPLIILIYFFVVYGNFLSSKIPKEEVALSKESYFKENFKNLSKKEIIIKLSEKQHLSQEAITALEELLDKK